MSALQTARSVFAPGVRTTLSGSADGLGRCQPASRGRLRLSCRLTSRTVGTTALGRRRPSVAALPPRLVQAADDAGARGALASAACVDGPGVGGASLLPRTLWPERSAVMGGEPLASPNLQELRPMPGYGVRQSDRGTDRGRGPTRTVGNTPEDVARPHSVGEGMLPHTPANARDDVPAVAAEVNVYRSAASPAPCDEAWRAMRCRVGECGDDSRTSDRCRHCGQQDKQSLSAHA